MSFQYIQIKNDKVSLLYLQSKRPNMQHKVARLYRNRHFKKSWNQLANHLEVHSQCVSFQSTAFLIWVGASFPASLPLSAPQLPIRQTPAPHLACLVFTSCLERVEKDQGCASHVTAVASVTKQRKARHHAGYSFVGSKENNNNRKKSPAKTIKFSLRGEREERRSLDDLSTIIYGSIHSDDVGIWAVIMIVIIIVSEKNLYLGFM